MASLSPQASWQAERWFDDEKNFLFLSVLRTTLELIENAMLDYVCVLFCVPFVCVFSLSLSLSLYLFLSDGADVSHLLLFMFHPPRRYSPKTELCSRDRRSEGRAQFSAGEMDAAGANVRTKGVTYRDLLTRATACSQHDSLHLFHQGAERPLPQ